MTRTVLVADAPSVCQPGMQVGLAFPLDEKLGRPTLAWFQERMTRSILLADPRVDPADIEWHCEERED